MNNIWYLENLDLFDIMCPNKFGNFQKEHTFIELKKNDFIYHAGDPSRDVFLIAEGKVKIGYYTETGEEVVKAVLTKGEIFGELAYLGESKRREFAQTIDTNNLLCSINIEMMQQLMLENKSFSIKINKWIGFRLVKTERTIDSLVFKNVKTRLKDFIREMAERFGNKNGVYTIIKHPYTQKNIADLIGSSRQTVSTLLNEFVDEGILTWKRGKIVLKKELS